MGQISSQIQIFNKAFKIAWDLAVNDASLTPDLGPKLTEIIRRLIKDGESDAAQIGKMAVDRLRSQVR